MTIYVIADPHLGHTAMQDYEGRPTDFESRILNNLHRTLGQGDMLICLGDVCWGNDAANHKKLLDAASGCHTILIRGNHDKKSMTWYLNHGWDCVADEMTLNVFAKTVILSHRPIDRVGEFVNVHGHLHNSDHHPECVTDERHILVKMEHEYMPVALRKLVERKKR